MEMVLYANNGGQGDNLRLSKELEYTEVIKTNPQYGKPQILKEIKRSNILQIGVDNAVRIELTVANAVIIERLVADAVLTYGSEDDDAILAPFLDKAAARARVKPGDDEDDEEPVAKAKPVKAAKTVKPAKAEDLADSEDGGAPVLPAVVSL